MPVIIKYNWNYLRSLRIIITDRKISQPNIKISAVNYLEEFLMQEKNNLDAVAEKYKAEMMRLYSKKRSGPAAEEHTEKELNIPGQKKDGSEKNTFAVPEKIQCECETIKENDKFMVPPMPDIPYSGDKCSAKEAAEEKAEPEIQTDNEKCRFPSAEELIRMDIENNEESVPAMNMNTRQAEEYIPDTRFDSDADNCHMQGNYGLYEEDEKCAPDDPGKDDSDMCSGKSGQGFLQVEVTNSVDGSPVAGASVAVLRKIWDYDVLETMMFTDSNGMTEAIELEVIYKENDPRPYDEYMITVYKEGFYSVNMLSVPIFDTIKSIQPVEMNKAGECS